LCNPAANIVSRWLLKALKKLEVPLIIVGNFDFYHKENPTRYIFEELGGVWDDVKVDFNKVKKLLMKSALNWKQLI